MTEQTDDPAEALEVETDEDDIPVESTSLADDVSFLRPDHELETLVGMANKIGVGSSLTLVTNGAVVSGTLVGYGDYWTEIADRFDAMTSSNEVEQAALAALGTAYRKRVDDELPDPSEWPPRYIHLNNARVHDGSKYVNVGLWRGRIAAVVGWSFGEPSREA